MTSNAATDTDTDSPPIDYRHFQLIWDATHSANDGQARTRTACLRCRSRQSKCDGERPCYECRRISVDCVYQKPKARERKSDIAKELEEELEEELKAVKAEKMRSEIETMERALQTIGAEIVSMKKSKDGMVQATARSLARPEDYPNPPDSKQKNEDTKLGEGVKEASNDRMAVYQAIRGDPSDADSDGNTWVITMAKRRTRIEVTSARQLYYLLTHIANSVPSHIPQSPMSPKPIGTQAMGSYSPIEWPRWRETHAFSMPSFLTDPHPKTPPPAVSPGIEELMLDLILMQTVECASSFPRKVFSEKFHEYYQLSNHRLCNDPQYRALGYAIGAMNTRHGLLYHMADPVAMGLPAEIGARGFGRELSQRYFSCAREILIDHVLEHDEADLGEDTVFALHALTEYLIDEGRFKLASFYFSLALRVATQLGYHRVLRETYQTSVDADELEHALMWNFFACTDQALAAFAGTPVHTTLADTHLNLLGVTVRIPPNTSSDRIQRLNEALFWGRHSAISRDYLSTFWSEGVSAASAEDLDRFRDAFDRWSAELPLDLRIDPSVTGGHTAFRSRPSFILALHLQFRLHTSLLDLYHPFLPFIHPNPTSLPATVLHEAEHVYSSAAVTATQLVLTYLHIGGCIFPINMYPLVGNAHMLLAKGAADKEIRRLNRAYVARARRMMRGTREFVVGHPFYVGYVETLEEGMKSEGIGEEEDAALLREYKDWVTPAKVPGVGW